MAQRPQGAASRNRLAIILVAVVALIGGALVMSGGGSGLFGLAEPKPSAARTGTTSASSPVATTPAAASDAAEPTPQATTAPSRDPQIPGATPAPGVLTPPSVTPASVTPARDVGAAGRPQAGSELRGGKRAIAALGDRLDEAAKQLHMSPSALDRTLRQDHSLKVDGQGKLLYVDAAPRLDVATPDWSATPPYDTSRTFVLHTSSSPLKIYLDFTGHTTSNTDWNRQFNSGQPFTTPAFDLDGSPATLTSAEHAAIQTTWQSVREDYAPFVVDVTTQDPGVEGLRYSGAGDTAYGVRVVVGPDTWFDEPGGDTPGGVAYVGYFGYGEHPVYVFSKGASTTQKFLAEAAAHEVGHSVELAHDGTVAHDGTLANPYYAGHGSWAPIMGVSYYEPVSQWSKGEYAYANNKQNDVDIIASWIGRVADDYASGTATLGTLPAGTKRYGKVNITGDVDVFKFALGAERRLSITTWGNVGPIDADCNMRLILRNASGTQIAISGPIGNLGTAMTVTLRAGTYYAYVSGVGEGSPWNTGWSSYASLGYYGIVLNWA